MTTIKEGKVPWGISVQANPQKNISLCTYWILILALALESEDKESYTDWDNMGGFFVIFEI